MNQAVPSGFEHPRGGLYGERGTPAGFDKPMITYPCRGLVLTDIHHILVISTLPDTEGFKQLPGDGDKLGISISILIS